MRFEPEKIFLEFCKNVQICRHFGTPFVLYYDVSSHIMTSYDVLEGTRDFINRKTLRDLVGFSVSEKLSSCKDIVIQSLLLIDLFCVQLVKER